MGLDISFSSFGRSAVHVRSLVWRLVCTNGLRVPEQAGSFSFRDVGDPSRLRDGIGEAVPAALAHARGVVERWRGAVGVMVEHVADVIDQLRELTQVERHQVGDSLKLEALVHSLAATR